MTADRRVSIVLFDEFELLDAFGPIQLLSGVSAKIGVELVGPQAGPVRSRQGTEVIATTAYATAARPDIVMVPGGRGARTAVLDGEFVEWLRGWASGAAIVSSVCTGAALLAQAGLLDGYRATSNKAAFEWVRQYGEDVEWIPRARWVEDRDRWTSSGVSAGMDMTVALISALLGAGEARRVADAAELEVHTDATEDPFAELHGLG